MSMIIPDEVNMIRIFQVEKTAEIPGRRSRTNYCPKNDKMVFIKGGELLAGEFTKAVVGTASGGLNHVIWKEKGNKASRDFLTNCQSVVNMWLQEHGFTVGVQDAVAMETTKELIR